MSEDLLKTLEDKVQNAVEMVELLKVENAELMAENASLKEDRSQWEEKLTHLIGKFEQLEEAVGTENGGSLTDSEEDEDSEENEDSEEPSEFAEQNFSA